MSSGVNLPEVIVVDILSRLPAKPLGRSRCVSKSWRSILSHPQFIKTCLNRNNHRQKIVLVYSHSLYSVDFDQPPSIINGATKLNFDNFDNWFGVVGSCDGLLLVLDDDGNTFLVNPTTRELKELPFFPGAPGCRFSMYGLGFDSSTDDYRVVVLSFRDVGDTFVDVYALRANCWRTFQSSYKYSYKYDGVDLAIASGVLVNGYLHWSLYKYSDYPSVIAAFSLETKKFGEVAPPGELDKQKFELYDLLVVEGFLCILVSRSLTEETDLWIMKEYGNGDSRIKIMISEWNMIPLRLYGEEVLMGIDGERLVLYNAREKALVDLEINEIPAMLETFVEIDLEIIGIPAMFDSKGTFVESLVSPNCR